MEPICKIFRVYCMMNNCSMPTNRNLFISKPGNTLTNIIHIFTCNCHNYVARFGKFLLFGSFFANARNRTCRKEIIIRIDLPIMDTRNSIFSVILLLKTSSSGNCCNIAEFFYSTPLGQSSSISSSSLDISSSLKILHSTHKVLRIIFQISLCLIAPHINKA